MIVIVDTPREAELARRALAALVYRLGDSAPAGWREPQIAIREHSPSLAVNLPHEGGGVLHDGLMTYAQVARLTGWSSSTIGRHVKSGALTRVGRRITAESVALLLRNGTSR